MNKKEAEQSAKEHIGCFLKEMWLNVFCGIILFIIFVISFKVFCKSA